MSRNSRIMRVSPLFDDFITRKSRETGLKKIKLTEKIVQQGIIDEEIMKDKMNKELWGIFYKEKRK